MMTIDAATQTGFALLNELDFSEIAWLDREGKRLRCERGTALVDEGSHIETFYLVLHGLLGVTVGGDHGREIAQLGPGQIVGEMSFLEDRPASATVRALEDSEVLALSRSALEAKLRQDTAFSAHLYRGLAVVASRRFRNVLGELGRMLDTEPSAEGAAATRWSEIARQTQDFKTQNVAAGKLAPGEVNDTALIEPLRAFSLALDREIGPESTKNLDERDELGARVQRELLPFLLKACTPARLFQKPRGYPADFRAMEMIHANTPDGEGPMGSLIDRAFLSLPSINAIRASRKLLQQELRRAAEESTASPLRITSVGSAPAAELRGLVVAKGADVEATLIEFDVEALAAMHSNPRGARLRLELESLVSIALGLRRVAVEGQDFVYSLLISSLPDRFAVGLLNYLYSMLRPGGWACVGCLDPKNPDKTFLAHVLGWNIVHRDENDLNTLFRHSAFGSACERFEVDEHGLFRIAACQKPKAS